jgi:hypothetical protein
VISIILEVRKWTGLTEKAQKIRMRLGGSANVLEDFPDKRNSCAGGPMIVCVALTISLKLSTIGLMRSIDQLGTSRGGR